MRKLILLALLATPLILGGCSTMDRITPGNGVLNALRVGCGIAPGGDACRDGVDMLLERRSGAKYDAIANAALTAPLFDSANPATQVAWEGGREEGVLIVRSRTNLDLGNMTMLNVAFTQFDDNGDIEDYQEVELIVAPQSDGEAEFFWRAYAPLRSR